MSLFKTIYSLERNQLKAVAATLGISDSRIDKKILRKNIAGRLEDYYKDAKGHEVVREYIDILRLWRGLVKETITKRKVRAENDERKQGVLSELTSLDAGTSLNCPDKVESVVRDILLLLWEESTEAEKQRFRDVVKQDLNKHNVKFTEQEFNKAMQNALMGGAGSALPYLTTIVTGYMLKQTTTGFAAWLAVNFLGQKALQVAALGLLSGPIATGIAVGTLGIGTITSVVKYQGEKQKLAFVQAILSIYSYSYQNRFNQRHEASKS